MSTLDIERPSWDEYGLLDAISAATRSTCLTRYVGAAIYLNNRPIAKGYNGAKSGEKSCLDQNVCVYREKAHRDVLSGIHQNFEEACAVRKSDCIAVHAEVNAFNECLKHGISTSGATLYVTAFPCEKCVREVIIPGGIKRVVSQASYQSRSVKGNQTEESMGLLKKEGVEFVISPISEERIRQLFNKMLSVGKNTDYVYTPFL